MLYFDHNATAPMSREAREAWLEAVDNFPANPSSQHRLGARADAALQSARERLAAFLGCDAFDLIWTSGGTESNNLVLHHYGHNLPKESEVWVSDLEHPSILATASHYFGPRLRRIPAERNGAISLACLRQELPRHRPALLVAMAANNETGVLQPWPEVLELCQGYEVPLLCDAVQWIGKMPAAGLGQCHFLSGCAHKFGGPRGIGFLKCPAGFPLEPLIRGGPQEDGRRAGTENVAGAVSMLAALEAREKAMQAGEHEKRSEWRSRFERSMMSQLPGAEVVGIRAPRLWNTVSALMPDADCQHRWVVKLDKLGFAVSTGSACASGREEASHVLSAMGHSAAEASRVLRFSSGWETAEADWQSLLEGLEKVQAEFSTVTAT
jgi:cysteine desulfurase